MTQTVAIDFASPGSRQHLLDGWSLEDEREDRPWVWAIGGQSSLRVYFFEPRTMTMVVRCSGPDLFEGAPRQLVTVLVNGASIGTAYLFPIMQEYRWEIPESVLRMGENRLTFVHGYDRSSRTSSRPRSSKRSQTVAFRYVRFEGQGEPPQVHLPDATSLALPFRAQIVYWLKLSPGAVLLIDGIWRQPSSRAGGTPTEVGEAGLSLAVTFAHRKQ